MHDQVLVGVLHRLADAQEQAQARGNVERLVERIGGDRHALDVFHDQVGRAIRGDAAVDQARDVRMFEAREDLAFLAEAMQQARCRISDLLDRHALLEFAVAALGEPHLAHAADTQAAQHAIGSEPARLRGVVVRGSGCDQRGRALHEVRRALVGTQQALDFGAQRVVVAALCGQPGGALRDRKIYGVLEQFCDTLAVHGAALRIRIQRGVQVRLGAPPVAVQRALAHRVQSGDIADR